VLSGRGNWCPRLSALTVWASGATRVDNSWCVARFLAGEFVFAIFWSFGLFGLVWGVFSCCRGDISFADLPSDSPQIRFSCSSIVLALIPLIVVPHYREGWSVVVVDIHKERIAELVSLIEFTD
jgi:hypothetical protein